MNNNLLQIKIKQRLNKLASFDYDNIECWQIQEAFNKAQLEWVRRQIYGINSRQQGSEESTGLVDDLQVILKSESLFGTKQEFYYQADIPDDYLYFVRVDAFAITDCCNTPRRMTIYQTEEANIGIFLNSDTKGPNFEWGETLSTIVGNKIRIYTNGKFDFTSFNLTYFRKPVDVQIDQCININRSIINSKDVECEFKDDIAEIIVDQAVAILAGDIESMTQFQREQQSVQTNS
jgi:hypothetical protein